MSYHICGKLEVAFKASPSSQHQHCIDEAQKALKGLQLTRLLVEWLPEDFLRQAFVDLGEIIIIIIIHNLYSAALLKDPAALYNNDNVNIKSVR